MNGHGIEQDMRPTFKTFTVISSKSGVIASAWQHGKTDSEVLAIKQAASQLSGDAKPVTSATAYDGLNERHGAYRWTYEGKQEYFGNQGRVNVTVWAVREYK